MKITLSKIQRHFMCLCTLHVSDLTPCVSPYPTVHSTVGCITPTVHSTPYTLHYTLHPTVHSTPYTLHYTLHPTVHPTPYSTQYTLHPTVHSTPYTLQYTLHPTVHSTPYTLQYTLHPVTLHPTRHPGYTSGCRGPLRRGVSSQSH